MLIFPNDLEKVSNKVLKTALFSLCSYKKTTHSKEDQEVLFKDYALVFIVSGSKKIYSSNQRLNVEKNGIIFFTKNTFSIRDYLSTENVYESIILCFKESVLIDLIYKYKDLIQNINSVEFSKKILSLDCDIITKSIFNALLPHIENQNKSNEALLKLKFEELFLSLLYSENNKDFLLFLKEILNGFSLDLYSIFAYCENDFENVASMAKFSKMDIASFSRNFKQSFGISAKEWLDNKRFEKAKFLLEFSTKNITQICFELGFNSPAWFIARYKKRYGITPKQEQKSKNLYFLN
ncbi:helix-turn-helix domain-containing protein [Campylobacter peloridis]|uniref:helix-turn-helix domain-containing protein n=1 Tax=Campylobacter peloridis TaxID=488546 RepID=UPI001C73613A|nr:AraC family transcriptional regulator [Campylobacter peloridis]MBX1886192.1 helix-turn-helix transcriptional regulator [Campylobacter peloridis]